MRRWNSSRATSSTGVHSVCMRPAASSGWTAAGCTSTARFANGVAADGSGPLPGAVSLIVIELKQQFLDAACTVAAVQHVARGMPAQLHAGAVEPLRCSGGVAKDPPGKFQDV